MSKITKSARGEECQIRIPGHCNHDASTTVLCHINGGGGMKQPDTEAAYGCSACHDIVDFRVASGMLRSFVMLYHHEGAMRTRKILIDKGLLVIA
jgi:hypothetical protein